MATTTRRVYLEKTVKYKFALDIPNSAGLSNTAALAYATGPGGPLNANADIGELLAGSDWTDGSITVSSNWAVSSSPAPANVEAYSVFVPNYSYSVGDYVVPADPSDAIASNGTAYYYRVTSAGTSGSSEPNWPTTTNANVNNGSVTFQAKTKF